MNENRREFFRVGFNDFIDGEIILLGSKSLFVDIYDISVTGLRFFTSIDIPLHERIECSFVILDSKYRLDGTIVRKLAKSEEIEYGVTLDVDQATSSHLFKQLNYYQIRQRKGNTRED